MKISLKKLHEIIDERIAARLDPACIVEDRTTDEEALLHDGFITIGDIDKLKRTIEEQRATIKKYKELYERKDKQLEFLREVTDRATWLEIYEKVNG